MKLGTIIKMEDGRVGTVVYNSLIGVGVKWGEHSPKEEDFAGTTGNLIEESAPDGWEWTPDALLRKPFHGCTRHGFEPEQCVGEDFEVVRKP